MFKTDFIIDSRMFYGCFALFNLYFVVAAYQPALAGLLMAVFPGSCVIMCVLYICSALSRQSREFDDLVLNDAYHVSQRATNGPGDQWVSLLLIEMWDEMNKERQLTFRM